VTIYIHPDFPANAPQMYAGLKIKNFLINEETDEIVYGNLVQWNPKDN
jgi:hypothetical protein